MLDCFGGMVFGMATTKITVTLPDNQIHSIRELVAAGNADSVSAFVKDAVEVALFDAAGWRAILDDALHETGGSMTNEERKWADALLHPLERRGERKKGTSSRGTGKNRAA
jgi:Arc/MetJ-type ribon-helix-helix transcriptional regulator